MMKRLVLVALSLLLALSMASVALAVPFTLEEAGVTIEVPDGMTGEDQSNENAFALKITVDDNPALIYVYALSYEEAFEGRWMEDLTTEEGEQMGQQLAAVLENPQFGQVTDYDYPLLLASSGDGTQLHYISVLNGWVCDVAAVKTDGVALTEDEIKAAAELLVSIQFMEEGAEEAEEAAE
ncbi:MAG: hypothetical protein VB099_19375 [Candidatus Limiplasma sp.]|nr:hypothetical protein [Candidatus Limiplasma sp.]